MLQELQHAAAIASVGPLVGPLARRPLKLSASFTLIAQERLDDGLATTREN